MCDQVGTNDCEGGAIFSGKQGATRLYAAVITIVHHRKKYPNFTVKGPRRFYILYSKGLMQVIMCVTSIHGAWGHTNVVTACFEW